MSMPTPAETVAGLPRALRDAVLERLIARRLKLGASAAPGMVRTDRTRPVPATLGQAFVLKQHRRTGGRAAWTLAMPPIVLDAADVASVGRAVARLARRHDALHMTLREENGRLVQILNPDARVPFTATKLPLTAAMTGAEPWLRRRYAAMLAEPFDPEHGPLWRAELVSRGGRGVILMTVCSLVADGESLHLIEADLRALYEAERTGATAPEPPLLDYADHAAAEDGLVRAGHFDGPLAWWRERLVGGPPAAPSGGSEGAGPARLFEQVLGQDNGRALDAYAATHRTTPHVVLLTEFMAALHALEGMDDLWVASATALRERPETQAMVGTFARLVPLRLSWPREADALPAVGAMLIEAMDQPPVPHLLLEDMLEAARPGGPSAFRFIFNHRHVGDGSEGGEAGDVPFRPGPKHAEAAREEDILLMVLQSGERRTLHWYLRDDRFAPAEAEDLLRRFHAALLRRLETRGPR